MGANERALTPTMVAASKRGDFALRFYMQGDGTSNLLCLMPGIECPQWYYTMDHRYTFASPPEALAFLGVIRSEWPEFLGQDVRVVRVIPARAEAYVEVMCPEDGCEEAAS